VPIDYSQEVQEAVIRHLRNNAAIKKIVGDRVSDEPDANVAWPHIRYGVAIAAPFEATCLDGSVHRVTLHAFARGPGRAQCNQLARLMVEAMDGLELDLRSVIDLQWISTQVFTEGQKSAYHAVVEHYVTVA
jgi:hypothetical protein